MSNNTKNMLDSCIQQTVTAISVDELDRQTGLAT